MTWEAATEQDFIIITETLYQYCNDCYMDEETGEFEDCVCGGDVLFAIAALNRIKEAM